MSSYSPKELPSAFIWRRLHSLTGLFLVLYLIEHLLVNSQAALFVGDDGLGFVKAVNDIHDLPYLPFIEAFLLGVPILIHMVWGIRYLQTGEQNAYGSIGDKPYLPDYKRNQAYTWQRITSWILVFAIIAHVIHMRFLEYPKTVKVGGQKEFLVKVKEDAGLNSLAERLGFKIYTGDFPAHWQTTLQKKPLKTGEVAAISSSFGMAELLMVRETFKSPLMIALYTIFVLSACFHAFNGLWTFMISWGITLTERSQRWMRHLSNFLMVIVAFWGLAAIWGTFWINLKQ